MAEMASKRMEAGEIDLPSALAESRKGDTCDVVAKVAEVVQAPTVMKMSLIGASTVDPVCDSILARAWSNPLQPESESIRARTKT